MSKKKNKSRFNTVMLIDDNEIDNFINEKMIEGCNIAPRVYIHTSSKSALEFLHNLQRAKDIPEELIPEIIFLDINMPMMDGFQFIDEFEKMEKSITTHCKIVMLTTSINPADVERSKKYKNVIRYLNKPLTQESLDSL